MIIIKKNSFLFLILNLTLFCGCSVFIGHVQPIEKKSSFYFLSPEKILPPPWLPITKYGISEENEKSDVAYKSQESSSIISLNSICQKSHHSNKFDNLKDLTKELILGLSNVRIHSEEEVQINSIQGLKTTITSLIYDKEMLVQIIVLKQGSCIYDFMLITRPENFTKDKTSFDHFVHSIEIKKDN